MIKKNRVYNLILTIVFVLYAVDILLHYLKLDKNLMFGYLDLQAHWQSVDDLLRGKIIYRDFYWEYGIFMLLIRVPFHLIFGGTFLSNLINGYFFLPALGVILSYLLAKQYVGKKGMIIFLVLMLLYQANNDYNAIRHLIPELGLLTAILGILNNKKRKRLVGSLLLGISLLSSPEYAIIGNLSYVVFLILYAISFRKSLDVKSVSSTLIFQLIIGGLYTWYLLYNNAISGLITFTREQISAFYTDSPCREVFPRFEELSTVFAGDGGFFNNLFQLFYRLNIYGVFVILIFLLIWTVKNRQNKLFTLNVTLILYSVLAYTRTINTPCYFHYGLTFTILQVSYLCTANSNKRSIKTAAIIIAAWLVLGSRYHAIMNDFRNYLITPDQTDVTYLPVAGLYLDRNLTDNYNHVIEYISKRTTTDDYVYVYPDGPYNRLLNRPSPVSPYSSLYYGLAPSLVEPTFNQLATAKPKYVIINKYNSSSYVSAIRGVQYNIHQTGDSVIFQGITTKIEDYLSANYRIADKNNVAWILEKRERPVKPANYFTKLDIQKQWGIKATGLKQKNPQGPNAYSYDINEGNFKLLLLNNFRDVTMIEIPVKFDLGMSKLFSKFIIKISIMANDGREGVIKYDFISSKQQKVTAYIPKLPPGLSVKGIIIEASSNKGFFVWGKPWTLEIGTPILYKTDFSNNIEDSIIKN